MLYGILIAVSGLLGGGLVAMYYRYNQAKLNAKIAGLGADVAMLKRDVSDYDKMLVARDKQLAQAVIDIQTVKADHAQELAIKEKLLKDARHDFAEAQEALRKYRAADPAGVAASLGELFPVPPEDGGQGSAGGASGGGAGHP